MTGFVHEFTVTLPAPPDRVFAALSDPAQLRGWFAEHAEVEPQIGGAYRFWGRHSYATPTRADATQTLTAFEPDRLLAYRWSFGADASEVRYALEPKANEAGVTVLRGRHTFDTTPAIGRAKELIDDLWRLVGGNLYVYLTSGKPALLPDFIDGKPEIRLSILIDAPRDRVFRALLDPTILDRWLGGTATVEPRIGGRLSYGWRYKVDGRDVDGGPTRILDLVENERLVTDWPDWRGDPAGTTTTVTWLLATEGTQTRLTLIHDGFERTADLSDYPMGWFGFLESLKGILEA